jgi:hypothetical protein
MVEMRRSNEFDVGADPILRPDENLDYVLLYFTIAIIINENNNSHVVYHSFYVQLTSNLLNVL